MTTKPTKEQIEAAKACLTDNDEPHHRDAVREVMMANNYSLAEAIARILLAALESAEARILELEEKVESLGYEVQDANNRSVE